MRVSLPFTATTTEATYKCGELVVRGIKAHQYVAIYLGNRGNKSLKKVLILHPFQNTIEFKGNIVLSGNYNLILISQFYAKVFPAF
jgi:hypothetical protein